MCHLDGFTSVNERNVHVTIVSETQPPSADLTALTLNFLKGHLERLYMCEIPLMCLLCLSIICKRKQKKNTEESLGHRIPFKP